MVTPLEKGIWDEAFADKFTDGAVTVAVVVSTDSAVNVAFAKRNDNDIDEDTEEVASIVVKDEDKER